MPGQDGRQFADCRQLKMMEVLTHFIQTSKQNGKQPELYARSILDVTQTIGRENTESTLINC